MTRHFTADELAAYLTERTGQEISAADVKRVIADAALSQEDVTVEQFAAYLAAHVVS